MRGSILFLSCLGASLGLSSGHCPSVLPKGDAFSYRGTKVYRVDSRGNQLTANLELTASVHSINDSLVLKGELIVRSSRAGERSFRDTFLLDTQYRIDKTTCVVFLTSPGIGKMAVDRADRVTRTKTRKWYRGGEYIAYMTKMVGLRSSLVSANSFGKFSPGENRIVLSSVLALRGKQRKDHVGGGWEYEARTGRPVKTVCNNGACYGRDGMVGVIKAHTPREGQRGPAVCTNGVCVIPNRANPTNWKVYGSIARQSTTPAIPSKAHVMMPCPNTLAGFDFELTRSTGPDGDGETTTKITLSVHPRTNTVTMRTRRYRGGVTEGMVWNMGAYNIDQGRCAVVFAKKLEGEKVDVVKTSSKGERVGTETRKAVEYLKEVVAGMGGVLDREFGKVLYGGKFIALTANLFMGKSVLLTKPVTPVTPPASKLSPHVSSGKEAEPVTAEVGCTQRLPASSEFRMSETRYDSNHAMVLVVVNMIVGSSADVVKLQMAHSYFEQKSKILDYAEVRDLPYVIDQETCILSFTGSKFDSVQLERTIAGNPIVEPTPVSGRAHLNTLLKVLGSGGFAGKHVFGKVDGPTIKLSGDFVMKRIQ